MIRLKEQDKDESICVDDMKDGDVGVITEWCVCARYVGEIVQRYKNYLLTVGASSRHGWGEYFPPHGRIENCRVRLLKSGEVLVVE